VDKIETTTPAATSDYYLQHGEINTVIQISEEKAGI
jgi:hypothetical protein